LHIYAVEQTMLLDSQRSYNINNMIRATYMSSEKEAALGLPQLNQVPATAGMWMERYPDNSHLGKCHL